MKYRINKENYKTFSVFEENRMSPRTYFIPFSQKSELAITSPQSERYYSDKVTLLSGEWDFIYYDKVSGIADEFDSDEVGWQSVSVPSVWQRTGFESPVYLNHSYPFPSKPPRFPYDCPAGIYRKRFSVQGYSRHILTFLGAAGGLEVYVNGKRVGYGEGSHNTQEFDITPFVQSGENELVAVLFKWSNGTYLECQDMFRENGIFRDVYITSLAEYDFWDIKLTPKKSGFGWELQIAAMLNNKDDDFQATAYLYDNDRLVAQAELRDNYAELTDLEVQEWSAEIPYLYELYLEIAHNGETLSVVRSFVGFKEVSIDGEVFKINGRAVKLLGVNRHDTHPQKGYAISVEDIERDILLLKQFNCNAVRTSHYPPDPVYLQLCDIYGLYVIDEADIECHGAIRKGRRGRISNRPEWEGHFLDRVKRMVIRDYNRACVVMWSLGNESGGRRNQDTCARWIKKVSPLPVHYENVYGPVRFGYDVTSRMYTHPETLEKIGQGKANIFYGKGKKPFFLCEYAHAMGVGPGSLKEYTDAFLKYDNLMGGCVWEMIDHAVEGYSDKYRYTYGGDHGEAAHDGNFCVDGLFFPDRTPHTGAYAMLEAYRPIRAQMLAPDVFTFKNIRSFKSAEDIRINWLLLKNGEEADGSSFIADIAPGDTIVKNITYKDMDKDAEYVLRFTYTNLEKTLTLGNDEFIVQAADLRHIPGEGECKRSIEDGKCIIECENSSIVFDKKEGRLAGIKVAGQEVLANAVAPNIARADLDNDGKIKKRWKKQGLYERKLKVRKVTETLEAGRAVYQVSAAYGGKTKFRLNTVYELFADGSIKITNSIKSMFKKINLPRFGNMLRLNRSYENIEYYGRGEKENLPDFKLQAQLGRYSAKIADFAQNYIKPQESGIHTDMRLVSLTNKKGEGIAIKACCAPFIFNASLYDTDSIISAAHPEDLRPADAALIYIDGFMRGTGSNSCGPKPMEMYTVKAGRAPLTYSYIICPITKSDK
jgi:beta-galactosidase